MTRLYLRFDLEFTYYGHAMATWFKRDLRMTDDGFRAMTAGRLYDDFLRNKQRDIAYGSIVNAEDMRCAAESAEPDIEFLSMAERELGIDTIWRLAEADRCIGHLDHHQTLALMTVFLKYFMQEFTEHRPDAVVSFTSANLTALACYYVARQLGIPYVEMTTTRLRQRSTVTDNPLNRLRFVESRYRALLGALRATSTDAADQLIAEFRRQPVQIDGMDRALQIYGKKTSIDPRRVVGLLRVLQWYYFGYYRQDPCVEHPLRQTLRVIRNNLRRKVQLRTHLFEWTWPTGERYAYFPLHLQPEMTTMVLAPFWQDQLGLIENIARSLPPDLKLYVKEHVPMLGERRTEDYRRLKAIKNVRLVSPFASSLDLSRKAALVITITGTVGWEALLLGKPVITFGEVFYNALECVQKCRAIADLPLLIRKTLEQSPHDDVQLHAFVAALLDESFVLNNDEMYDPARPYESVRDSKTGADMYRAYLRTLRRLWDEAPGSADPAGSAGPQVTPEGRVAPQP